MENKDLLITATLGGPLIMNGPALWTPFDSLLAYFAVQRAQAKSKHPLEVERMKYIIADLPVEKMLIGDDFMHATSMVFLADERAHKAETIYKAIRPDRFINGGIDTETVAEGVKKRFIGAASGNYKTGAPELYPRLAKTARGRCVEIRIR